MTPSAQRCRGRSAVSDEQPRKRLLLRGAESLTDAELVEVLLGEPGATTSEQARELLEEFGGLAGLSATNPEYLRRFGVSKSGAATMLAAFEIACRVARHEMPQRELLDYPERVARYLRLRYDVPDQEVVGVLYLDVKTRLIGEAEIYRGALNHSTAEPRAIIKDALLRGADRLLIFHTHPSNDVTPSQEDLTFTRQLAKAAKLLGIRLADHLIVGTGGNWTSLSRLGAIPD